MDYRNKKTTYFRKWLIFGDLGGTRTHDPLIKSQLLYQLSYEVFLVDVYKRQNGKLLLSRVF